VLSLDTDPEQVESIMRSLPDAPDAPPLWRWIFRPVRVPAWGAALVLVGFGAAVVLAAGGRGPEAPAAAPAPVAVISPAPTAPAKLAADVAPAPAAECPVPRVLVRFHFRAPKARAVNLVGDFNEWSIESTPLADPDANGNWTVTVPLQPGRYQYKFLLDGEKWVEEPDAPAYQPDGFGGKNSLLVI